MLIKQQQLFDCMLVLREERQQELKDLKDQLEKQVSSGCSLSERRTRVRSEWVTHKQRNET